MRTIPWWEEVLHRIWKFLEVFVDERGEEESRVCSRRWMDCKPLPVMK